jgi:hypothetical protein
MRDTLGTPVHKKTKTPAPVAKTAPDFDIDSSVPGQLTINFRAHGQKISSGKPPGQHGTEMLSGICDKPPVSIEELTHSTFDTHTPYTFVFDGKDRGKFFYIALRWENTRGEKGPWSEIVGAVIP